MTPVCIVLETPDTTVVRADNSLTHQQLVDIAASVLKSVVHRGVKIDEVLSALDSYDIVSATFVPQPSVN